MPIQYTISTMINYDLDEGCWFKSHVTIIMTFNESQKIQQGIISSQGGQKESDKALVNNAANIR